MRLDKYLKVSRLIKRRTVANEACDNGRISVNGRVVKASYDVKVGDKLEITMGPRTIAVEVLVVADNVRKDDACAMYKEKKKKKGPLVQRGLSAKQTGGLSIPPSCLRQATSLYTREALFFLTFHKTGAQQAGPAEKAQNPVLAAEHGY